MSTKYSNLFPITTYADKMRTFSNSKTRKPQKLFISHLRFFPCDSVAIRNVKYYKTNTYNIILKIRVI